MIIVMKGEVGPGSPEVARVVGVAEQYPGIRAEVRATTGTTRRLVEVYVLGSTTEISTSAFEGFPGVEKVIRVRDRFRAIGRPSEPPGGGVAAMGFEYNGVRFAEDSFHVFAGLCAVDHRANVEATFRALKAAGVTTTRAGAYKPRTSPYDFQGRGKECLPYVFELAGRYGIRVVAMEVLRESHIEEIRVALAQTGNATGVMLQIGTRNAQNFELLKCAGQQGEFPVLFKRGMGITLEESLNAAEYIATSGNERIVFCLRGVKTHLGEPHRNFVDFAQVPVVRRLTRLPVCVDPSHAAGTRSRGPDGLGDIHQLAAQGVIAGANMVLVDVHPRPEEALCDGPQALTLPELEHFIEDMALVRDAYRGRLALRERYASQAAAKGA